MSSERRGLGKGLEALIPPAPTPSGVTEVEVDRIVPNPRQPRQALDPEALQELATSIEEQGLVQPLVVTEVEGGFQLLVGERRWRAAQLAGLEMVPVVIREATPQQMVELALVENLQREDLNPLETATAYQQLVEEFGMTQQEVADKVGKNRVTVTNTLRLLKLPDEVKNALLSDEISEGHARAMLRLRGGVAQLQVLQAIINKGLSVRQTEDLVRRMVEEPKTEPKPPQKSPELRALEDEFRQALGTKVNLTQGSRGGRLVIYYYSDEELQGIYDVIVGD
ncbi:MAG: ParB/RepB/Spo0J family partition protein [Anaerolineae bacterium]|nr:ParB/RepB/Spo0J family partition protein [Anaerolineae bacterium]NIN97486.1 ParB/RepB/Spo0J family partition protein [Anaerolineae bacterium]NIQ80415.1 ParB/RepB/Spo0J family partition protein [Anaerolineae bacterium]